MFRPVLLKILECVLPDMTWRTGDEGVVYLTFDDGPTPSVTPWVLDTLAHYGVKATFFCLGKNAEQHPDLFRAVIDGGHKVGNHSYSHVRGWGFPVRSYADDVEAANQILHSDLFRPPYGRIRRRQAQALRNRYRLVMGDVVSCDYSQKITPEKCLANVVDNVVPGSVVVFHDSVKAFANMRFALPRAIEFLRDAGYGFGTLSFDCRDKHSCR